MLRNTAGRNGHHIFKAVLHVISNAVYSQLLASIRTVSFIKLLQRNLNSTANLATEADCRRNVDVLHNSVHSSVDFVFQMSDYVGLL